LGLSENFPLHKAFISAVTRDGPKASCHGTIRAIC
jgi:hypothetical protein